MILYFWLVITMVCTLGIVVTDIRFYWIPDMLVAVLGLTNLAALAAPDVPLTVGVAAAMAIAYGLKPDCLGSGDVKLVAALCPGCTAQGAYIMIFIAVLSACLAALVLYGVKGKTMIPFGPFLLAGWWTAYAVGKDVALWLF